jgi:glyoxylase-like metal-dependent hydrolase (beta-lactamase superfamily II)
MIALPQIDAVIISDLVYNRVHPWIAEGRSQDWLQALKTAKSKLAGATTLYAGHGAAGPTAIIEEQAAYITAVRDLVAQALKSEGRVLDDGKASISQRISDLYPNWPLAMLIGMNIDGIASELSAN